MQKRTYFLITLIATAMVTLFLAGSACPTQAGVAACAPAIDGCQTCDATGKICSKWNACIANIANCVACDTAGALCKQWACDATTLAANGGWCASCDDKRTTCTSCTQGYALNAGNCKTRS